ncbi:hypothetical protein HDU93_002314 [Gonapodya sp. JEL0774]|nr:hypothetical protein HDU93_002314 [Gonapodya sp. JEL0774]
MPHGYVPPEWKKRANRGWQRLGIEEEWKARVSAATEGWREGGDRGRFLRGRWSAALQSVKSEIYPGTVLPPEEPKRDWSAAPEDGWVLYRAGEPLVAAKGPEMCNNMAATLDLTCNWNTPLVKDGTYAGHGHGVGDHGWIGRTANAGVGEMVVRMERNVEIVGR